MKIKKINSIYLKIKLKLKLKPWKNFLWHSIILWYSGHFNTSIKSGDDSSPEHQSVILSLSVSLIACLHIKRTNQLMNLLNTSIIGMSLEYLVHDCFQLFIIHYKSDKVKEFMSKSEGKLLKCKCCYFSVMIFYHFWESDTYE